jgi:hypothetical protein
MKQRIVTFDETTAQRLAAHDPELRDGTPLSEALAGDRPSVLLLPAVDPAAALIARLAPRVTERYGTGGFLGLSDEPTFDDENRRRD